MRQEDPSVAQLVAAQNDGVILANKRKLCSILIKIGQNFAHFRHYLHFFPVGKPPDRHASKIKPPQYPLGYGPGGSVLVCIFIN